MYSPKNASRPPLKTLEKLIGFFKRDDYFALKETIFIIWDEIENIYRLFRETDKEGVGGGGGLGATTPQAPAKVIPICNVVMETEKLGADETTWHPSALVGWRMWNDHTVRMYKSVITSVELTQVVGHIWIQSETGQPEQHFINMSIDLGPAKTQNNVLLGFNVGFERYDSSRKKFFLDVFEFSQEAQTKPTQLIDENPIASRKFRTALPILDDTLLAAYDMSTGGGGLRFKCDLTLFGK